MSASLSRLQSFYGDLKAPLLLHAVIKREFPGTVALLTSFASDCGLLLAMVAEIDPATPVLVVNHGAYGQEKLDYGRRLCSHLRLNRVYPVTPPGPEPLAQTLDAMGLLALITGREGGKSPRIELDEGGVFHIHPLAGWPQEAKNAWLKARNLPPHPLGAAAGLESDGFAPSPTQLTPAPAADWSV